MKRSFATLTDLKGSGHAMAWGLSREGTGFVRRGRVGGRRTGKSLYCAFQRKEQVRQGKQVLMDCLKNFSGLWAGCP